jgi:hypothetical protein
MFGRRVDMILPLPLLISSWLTMVFDLIKKCMTVLIATRAAFD